MDIKKYIYGHCVQPQLVKIWDSYSQSYVVREVPCGKCLHCRNTRINEWVTRLYAQAQYSTYIYYITLDYAPFSYSESAPPVGASQKLAVETAACYHSINSTNRFGLHPLLLKKNHLQDFFKRLRKNTGFKLQYFACGEYGTHANGHGYGRPHFHIILFSDDLVTPAIIETAWTINGYKIGSVKFEDISLESKGILKNCNNNAKSCFRYVAKYLQKNDFEFEKLATINFHRAYFKSLQYHLIKTDTLFPESVPITDPKEIDANWKKYCAEFAPFIVCSRRPSLGLAYLKDNLQRFKESDFRLFGLSKECDAFPRYFLRKTKESMCEFVAVGEVSQKPSTASRLGYIMSVLDTIRDSRLDFENFGENAEKFWYRPDFKRGCLIPYSGCDTLIPFNSLHIYNTEKCEFYQFIGYGYNVWRKVKKLGYVFVQYMDIIDVINRVGPCFESFYYNYVVPMHNIRVLREKELSDTISTLYHGDINEFYKEVYATYQAELSGIYKHDLICQNSRNYF